jgi:predicted AAA+ superfamily ATPase
MYSRILNPPKNKSFFLFGPRGTGKTTWVRMTFPNAVYIDLLEAEVFNDLLANPQRLENFIPKGYRSWVIIDEVQRIPELLNEVHRLIEKYHYKFVLTGSSARKIRRRGINLLGGRALTYEMHPLISIELGSDFNIEHSLKYGQLPSAYTDEEPKRYLESYVKTYLEEEIRQEGLTRNLSAFARFLESASFSQGGVLNISNIARDCGVERKVVENYFNILEDLLIGYKLPVFAKKARRRLICHPKFYFFDVGVYRTLRPKGPLDRVEEIEGVAFESLLFQELRAIVSALKMDYKMYYWRTSSNTEVDFILYGEKGIFAFEVKRTARVSSKMLTGLKSFLKDYPIAKAFFVYGGTRIMREGEIELYPLNVFLKRLPQILEKGAEIK